MSLENQSRMPGKNVVYGQLPFIFYRLTLNLAECYRNYHDISVLFCSYLVIDDNVENPGCFRYDCKIITPKKNVSKIKLQCLHTYLCINVYII